MAGPRRDAQGRYAKGAAKRAEILEVALDLIARHGYRRSTLREIATSVGLTNAGVLHYFGSREELFTEVLRLRDEADRDHAADGGDPLRQFVDVIGHNADVPGLVHLYSSLAAEAVDPGHEAHRFFADRYRTVRRELAAAIHRRVEAGRLRDDVDADRLARMMVALADGLQTQWLIEPDFDMSDDVAALVELASVHAGDTPRPRQPGGTS